MRLILLDSDADLGRRDFTVNALAVDGQGALVDPFGGLEDLDARLIRAVGVAAERFAEDGLRILRGARFVATLNFELEDDTEAAFEGALPVFARVSPERVRQEWVKTMKAESHFRKDASKPWAVLYRTWHLAEA